MKTIALWSPLPSGSGITALGATLPLVLALEFRLKTLLLHGGGSGERVEQAFSLRKHSLDNTLVTFQDHGMSAVERLATSGRLLPENFRDYTASILPDRMDFLEGSKESNSESSVKHEGLMSQIIETAIRGYDVIVADAGNGQPDVMDREILMAADLILIGVNQNLRSLEKILEHGAIFDCLQGKEIGFVIGRYDRSSHCTIQNLKRRFGIKGMVEGIPYCSQLTDAWNMRSVQSCIQRGRGGGERKRETPLYYALRHTALASVERLGLPSTGYTERGA